VCVRQREEVGVVLGACVRVCETAGGGGGSAGCVCACV